MKQLIALTVLMFAFSAQAAEPAKAPAKEQTNCVTKDKQGKCPPPPNSPKPTPKKQAEAK